jgi:hypothetical protein
LPNLGCGTESNTLNVFKSHLDRLVTAEEMDNKIVELKKIKLKIKKLHQFFTRR